MAAEDVASAYAETDGVRQVGNGIDTAHIEAVGTAATDTGATAKPCAVPLPGCQAFIAAVTEVTGKITEFATPVGEGLQTYTTIAATGAAKYESSDSAGAALIRGAAAGALNGE